MYKCLVTKRIVWALSLFLTWSNLRNMQKAYAKPQMVVMLPMVLLALLRVVLSISCIQAEHRLESSSPPSCSCQLILLTVL